MREERPDDPEGDQHHRHRQVQHADQQGGDDDRHGGDGGEADRPHIAAPDELHREHQGQPRRRGDHPAERRLRGVETLHPGDRRGEDSGDDHGREKESHDRRDHAPPTGDPPPDQNRLGDDIDPRHQLREGVILAERRLIQPAAHLHELAADQKKGA